MFGEGEGGGGCKSIRFPFYEKPLKAIFHIFPIHLYRENV